MTIHQARCPVCNTWSEVTWQDELLPGGFWWRDTGCCPECDSPICVESECEFRDIKPDSIEAILKQSSLTRDEQAILSLADKVTKLKRENIEREIVFKEEFERLKEDNDNLRKSINLLRREFNGE